MSTSHRWSLRARLAATYGVLALVTGLLMLGVTYLLVSAQLPNDEGNITQLKRQAGPTSTLPPTPPATQQPGGESQDEFLQSGEISRSEALSVLFSQSAIALGVVVAVSSALGWILAGRALRPLERMTDTALRIAHAPTADRALHERISLTGPTDEIKQLADAFDVMLARLDASFDSQRRFVANASHELRTPLTVNRALLEVALHRDDNHVGELATTLLAVNQRHEKLIDGLHMLAVAENQLTERSYVDLFDIAEHLVATVDADVPITLTGVESPTSGDAILLEQLVRNLLENAVRYNVTGGWVRVNTGVDGENSFLRISNSGPVVPRYEIPTIFLPFRRLGPERVVVGGGAGLGLSIVAAIAAAHGGAVTAESRDGGGLIVTVTLPTAHPDSTAA